MTLFTHVCSSCCLDKCKTAKSQHPSSAFALQNQTKTSCSQWREVLQLKVQLSFLEKSQKSLIGTLKNLESHHIKELYEFNEELSKQRLQEIKKLQKDIVSVFCLLKDLKKDVAIEKLKEINIDQFEASLMDLENKIAASKDIFGEQSSQLHHQEQDLQAHVTSMANKIDEWAKPTKVDTVFPSVHHTAALFNSGRKYNENVNAFQKFLWERGGHRGGWDEADHLIFIRLRRKHQNEHSLLTSLREEFPDKSSEELCKHGQWFTDYEELKAKQKQAISDWRVNKNSSLHGSVSCTAQLPEHTSCKDLQKRDICSSEHREQQKKQLQQWRNMKELELQMQALRRKEEHHKQLIEEEAKKIRHAIQKVEVVRYKEQKFKENFTGAFGKTIPNVQSEDHEFNAKKTLKAFRQRDAEILARQKEMKDRLQQERKKKLKILEALRKKVRVEVARDPHRLLRPTDAWREHTKVTKSAESISTQLTFPLNVQEVPHLKIPMWRKNQK